MAKIGVDTIHWIVQTETKLHFTRLNLVLKKSCKISFGLHSFNIVSFTWQEEVSLKAQDARESDAGGQERATEYGELDEFWSRLG